MTLKFSVKFDHKIVHVFIFGSMFHESHGFAAMQVTRTLCQRDTF